MRVLGIDPALTRCGLGGVDASPGRPPTLVGVGVTRTPATLETARRLVQIEEAVEAWVREHRPDAVAVERVFAQHNVPIDAEKGATLMKLISLLEEDDDVQNVYANFDMSDEDLAKLEA